MNITRLRTEAQAQWRHFAVHVAAGALLLIAHQGYSQQSFTFTPAGATGRFGPTQSQVSTAYASTNLNGSVTINTQGIQEFTIPASGAYRLEAYGAQGYGAGGVGGRGAMMSGEFQLTAGQVIKIMVGQAGELPSNASYNAQYPGGGGSFITDASNNALVVAGGGGGNWTSGFSSTSDSPTVTTGNTGAGVGSTGGNGGTSGSGGIDNSSACGGGGFSGNGGGTAGGIAFLNGGTGGFTTYGEGGFGGGGGTSSYNNRRAGGGGGYSGGGGSHGGTTGFPEGGGGGSYNAGTNQNNAAGVNTGDGYVIVTKLCNVNLVAASNPVCSGSNLVLSTNAIGGITWAQSTSTSNSIAVTPTVTTTYSVTGTGTPSNCVSTAVLVVSVMPLPTIGGTSLPLLLCVGQTGTVMANGAVTYSWSTGGTGSATPVNPSVTTTYTVTGTDVNGCVNSGTVAVNVNSNSLTVSANTTVCEGTQVTLYANGAMSYTWSNGLPLQSIVVTPSTTTNYSVQAIDNNYCMLMNSVMVTVNPRPNVTAGASQPQICRGESVILSATGGDTYLWSNQATTYSTQVTPAVDVPYVYTVTATNANGCSSTATVLVNVSKCAGISSLGDVTSLTAFPNPVAGKFSIRSSNGEITSATLSSVDGRHIMDLPVANGQIEADLSGLQKGIYLVKVQQASAAHTMRIIKE